MTKTAHEEGYPPTYDGEAAKSSNSHGGGPQNGRLRPILRGRRCQCAGCGAVFGSLGPFDRHRVGQGADRWCLSEHAMQTVGLRLIEGVWRGEPRPWKTWGVIA